MGEKMKVDEKLVKRVGSAMKLKFSEDELKSFMTDIEATLNMLETLEELDTDGVEGTFHGGPSRTALLRKDEAIKNDEEVRKLLEAAPARAGQLIEVPAILDDGEGGA